AVVVFGPFMVPDRQAEFAARAAGLPNVRTLTFDARLEGLITRADGIVAMGGYNTFCEILSFDKPALIVPRTTPRLEQFIRAQRAAELGLAAILPDEHGRGAAAADTAEAALRGGHPGAARRHGQRQPAGPPMAAREPPRAHQIAGRPRMRAAAGGRVAFVVKGYPRLSETFIAQE